jgi:hypothetical protein
VSQLPITTPGVADVELLRGEQAAADAPPDLLVEVPHGADRRAHYDALRQRLAGDLPADLHTFFSFNTDVGAWSYGRETARRLLQAEPTRSALVVRCLIPRTFVDCNRHPDYEGGDLQGGALTAGIPVYVRDDGDRELLLGLHQRYVALAEQAYEAVCGAGGVALVPHTYGPRSVGIHAVEDDIVEQLRWACEPDRWPTWPLRAEVDLLTRDGDGTLFAPPGLEDRLMRDFEAAGFAPVLNDTYCLHPVTLAYRWSETYPGQVLCLEARRDLLTTWSPFEEMTPQGDGVARVANVLAPALAEALRQRPSPCGTREDA